MKSIVLDELLYTEIEAALGYLGKEAAPSGVEGIFWLELPRELWEEAQIKGHESDPEKTGFKSGIEVGPDWIRFELLIRSGSLHNIGGGHASEKQVLYILRWAENMARTLSFSSCVSPVN